MTAKVFSLLKPRSVGIWVRVSTDMQGDSPLHQEARIREYASQKGWEVAVTYNVEVSGKSIIQHESTKQMMTDVASGKITCLVICKFARLTRNLRELLELVDFFMEHQAEIVSLDEPIPWATNQGRLTLSLAGSLAEWERGEIAARVAASVPIRAKLGKCTGGAAPFGYKWAEGKKGLEIDEKEGPVRKLMYELYLKHMRKRIVTRLLNEAGYRTRNGAEFSTTSVLRLLRDPTAKGKRRANYTRAVAAGKNWVEKPQNEWVWLDCPALVSEELWTKVNQLLDVQREKFARVAKPAVWLFGGKTLCGCGSKRKMYKPSNTPKYVCYECRNKIHVEALETTFVRSLRALFSGMDLRVLLERANEELEGKREAFASLEAELCPVREEMNKCYRAYVANTFDEKEFGELYRPLKKRAQSLEEKLATQRAEIEALEYRCSSLERTRVAVQQVFDIWWVSASEEDRRQLVERIVSTATIDKDEVVFTYHYICAPQEVEGMDFSPLSLLCGVSMKAPRCDRPQSLENFDVQVQLLNVNVALVGTVAKAA